MRFFPRSFWHQRIYNTTLGFRDPLNTRFLWRAAGRAGIGYSSNWIVAMFISDARLDDTLCRCRPQCHPPHWCRPECHPVDWKMKWWQKVRLRLPACLPKKSFNECTSTALLHAQCLIKQCVLSNKYLVTDKKCGFIGSCRNLQRLVSMSQSQFLATWWNVFQVLQTTASNALSALPLGFELGASWIFVCIVSCESETSCAWICRWSQRSLSREA